MGSPTLPPAVEKHIPTGGDIPILPPPVCSDIDAPVLTVGSPHRLQVSFLSQTVPNVLAAHEPISNSGCTGIDRNKNPLLTAKEPLAWRLKTQMEIETSKFGQKTARLWQNRRTRATCFILLGLILLSIAGGIIGFYFAVPKFVQKAFDNPGTGGSAPSVDFSLLLNDRFYFNVNWEAPLHNFVSTRLYFEQPVVMNLNGAEVLAVEFPELILRRTERCAINHNFTATILDSDKWDKIWQFWIQQATNSSLQQQDTFWDLRTRVTVEMLGFRWANVEIKKSFKLNGGIPKASTREPVRIRSWDFIRNLTEPGLKLDLVYQNVGTVGIHLGNVQFGVRTLYRPNSSPANNSLVDILNVNITNFYLKPGANDLLIENQFLRSNVNSIRAATQLITNFVANETSILQFTGFNARYPWQNSSGTVWLNKILKSVSFKLSIHRNETLTSIFWRKANAFGAAVQGTLSDNSRLADSAVLEGH